MERYVNSILNCPRGGTHSSFIPSRFLTSPLPRHALVKTQLCPLQDRPGDKTLHPSCQPHSSHALRWKSRGVVRLACSTTTCLQTDAGTSWSCEVGKALGSRRFSIRPCARYQNNPGFHVPAASIHCGEKSHNLQSFKTCLSPRAGEGGVSVS